MAEKSFKYLTALFYAAFLVLYAYYSFASGRADGIIYAVFLSSFFLTASYLRGKYPEKTNEFLFYILFIAAVVLSVYGIFRASRFPGLRISGLLGDRTFESEAAAGIFVFFSAMFFINKGGRKRTLISAAGMFFSFSYISFLRVRTAYLGILVSFAEAAIIIFMMKSELRVFFFRTSFRRPLIFAAIIFFSSVVPLISPYNQPSDRDSFSKTVKGAFDTESSSNKARLDFWDASLKMFAENPLAGIGADMWAGYYPTYNGAVYTDKNIDVNSAVNPHNDYLRFLSEFGAAGIFYILFTAGGVLLLFIKTLDDFRNLPYLLIGVCYAVTSFFGFTYDNIFAMMLFLYTLTHAYAANNQKQNPALKYAAYFAGGPVLAVTAVLLIARIYSGSVYKDGIQYKFRSDYKTSAEKLAKINDVIYPADPNRIPVSYYLATAYFELKEYDKALGYFERAAKLMPYYPPIMSDRAASLYKAGKKKDAEELYKKASDFYPNFFEPQINLLALYANEKMHSEAKALIADLEHRITESKFIKNYIVFLEIKNYYVKNKL